MTTYPEHRNVDLGSFFAAGTLLVEAILVLRPPLDKIKSKKNV